MKHTDLLWLAGLLEGEGCFNIRSDNRVRIAVEMTDKDVVERVAKLFGTNVSHRAPRVAGRCKVCDGPARECGWLKRYPEDAAEYGASYTKESWQTAIHGDRARNLMRALYVLMGSRRRAKILLILGGIV